MEMGDAISYRQKQIMILKLNFWGFICRPITCFMRHARDVKIPKHQSENKTDLFKPVSQTLAVVLLLVKSMAKTETVVKLK